jgi:uncharacterized protein YjiS (DUF1127 family)
MASTWSHPIPVSRAAWLRLGDGVLDAAQASFSALHRLWGRWQAARRREAEFRALRQLSAGVLRDIGVSPEWINEAQRWCDQHHTTRDSFLRGL